MFFIIPQSCLQSSVMLLFYQCNKADFVKELCRDIINLRHNSGVCVKYVMARKDSPLVCLFLMWF